MMGVNWQVKNVHVLFQSDELIDFDEFWLLWSLAFCKDVRAIPYFCFSVDLLPRYWFDWSHETNLLSNLFPVSAPWWVFTEPVCIIIVTRAMQYSAIWETCQAGHEITIHRYCHLHHGGFWKKTNLVLLSVIPILTGHILYILCGF